MRFLFRHLLLLVLFTQHQFTFGQIHDFIQYGIVDGIAHTHITDICQDQQGNIWFATQGGGVSRFNGLSFKNYTVRDGLISNYIRKVVADKHNNIWFATAEGLSVLKNNKILNQQEIVNNDKSNALTRSINALFADSKDNIWFATSSNGLAKISSEGDLEIFDKSNGFVNDRVIDITEDDSGRVWFVTILNGLYQYNNDQFKHMIGVEDVKGYILSVDALGDSLWLGTNSGTFFSKIETDGSLSLNELKPLQNIFVKAIINRGEEKWVIAANGLMLLVNKNITLFSSVNGFTDETVLSGFKDREGNLWFGTSGEGAFRYTDARFRKFESSDLSDVRSITKDSNGDLWMGTFGNGIVKYDGNKLEKFMPSDGEINNYVTASITDKNGNIWFGTRNNGIATYNNGEVIKYQKKDGLINNKIRALYCDSKNNIWILTINGVSRLSNDTFENFTVNNGLLNGVVWNVIEDKDQLLLITRDGINVFANNKLSVLDTNHIIFDKRVNFITRMNTEIFWVGYSGYGVCKYNITSGETQFITTEDGLISDIVLSIVVLNEHKILVATERGIDEIIIDENANVQSIKHFGNTQKGVGLCNTNPGSFFIDNDKVWFGAKNGVFCFNKNQELSNSVEPLINITDVELIFAEDSVKNEYISNIDDEGIELPYTYNSVQISYFGTHIRHSTEVLYRYKLEGFQNDWSANTDNRHVSFTNLPPNDYTFKVMARNNKGLWTSQPAIFKFRILPPFYLTTWFFVVATILLIVITQYIHRFRVRMRVQKALAVEKIKEEEALRVRKMMARDFHDNMGNQLASITVFTNIISLKLKDSTDEIKGLLSNIEKHSKSLYTGTKDFIWSMDPESDNLLEIFTYLKDFGEELFDGTSMGFYSDADALEGRNVVVPSGWSRQLVLIFKEAMTNTLKYSQAKKVEINVNLNHNDFVLVFKDNGKGFDVDTIKKGNGLRNMEQRSNRLGTQFEISQLPEGGTQVSLSGSINSKNSKTN